MDRAEPAPEVMDVERVVREDGRTLLLFSWRPADPDDAPADDGPR